MGKQSSRIYFGGKDHKEIYYKGHYHDAMYKGSQLVWKKLKDGLKPITDVYFETVANAFNDYYAIIQFMYDGSYHYGIAYKKDEKWILIKRLGIASITKHVLYATTKGFVIEMISTPRGGTSAEKGIFRGWYYGLKEEIKNNSIELHELELLDDGDVLFDDYAEAICLKPKLNAYKNNNASFDDWAKSTSYITKRYKYEYEKVTWEEPTADGGTIEKTEEKWRIYDWKGNEITKPEDPSEYPPTEKTSGIRGVMRGFSFDGITYYLDGAKTSHVTGNDLAKMVGKSFPEVGVNCSKVYVDVLGNRIYDYDRRSLDGNGKTLQATQQTCIFGDNNRIMMMSDGYREKLTDSSYQEVRDIGVYEIGGTDAVGYTFNRRDVIDIKFDPYLTTDPPNIRNFGLYYAEGKIYALIYDDLSSDTDDGYPVLYVGNYDKKMGKYTFSKLSSEKYEYPFSFGGIIPGEDETYIVISKSSNNYHVRKHAYDSQGNIVKIPVYQSSE